MGVNPGTPRSAECLVEMTQTGLRTGLGAQIPSASVVSALACLPFRLVYVPTASVGRVVARLAATYRTASPPKLALILPAWAVLRGLFIVGCGLAHALHKAARSSLYG
jgi:hypothetical protein